MRKFFVLMMAVLAAFGLAACGGGGGGGEPGPGPSDEYTVTLEANGGRFVNPIIPSLDKPNPHIVTVTNGIFNFPATMTLDAMPIKTTSPSVWQGFYTQASGGEPISGIIPVTQDVTYYARWGTISPTIHDVYFKTTGGAFINGGSTNFHVEVFAGSRLHFNMYEGVSRSGYRFDGWYNAPSGGTKMTGAQLITAPADYYAQWIAIDEDDLILPAGSMVTNIMPSSGTIKVHYDDGTVAASRPYANDSFPEIVLGVPAAARLSTTDYSGWGSVVVTGNASAESTNLYITDANDVEIYCNANPSGNSWYIFTYSDGTYRVTGTVDIFGPDIDCEMDIVDGWNAILVSGNELTMTDVPIPTHCYWADE